jgi:hypothetical protein
MRAAAALPRKNEVGSDQKSGAHVSTCADPIHYQVAGHLEEEIADEEHARAKPIHCLVWFLEGMGRCSGGQDAKINEPFWMGA